MNFKEKLSTIKALVFDVDGVLSSDKITLSLSGEPMRTVNVKDGYALQLAVKKGFILGIITGGNTVAVKVRYERLGIENIYMSASNKMLALQDFLQKNSLSPEEVLFMGDDIPDYDVMKTVGTAVCPADAVPEIKEISCYISPLKGGEGCARDIVEQVMKAQNKWMNDKQAFGW